MALLSKKDEADDGESAASAKGVASRLKTLEERGFTGAVEIGVKGSSAEAAVYLYEGGIYAVHLEGYAPVLMDRLATEGVLDRARWVELATIFGPHRSHARVGPMAVEQEWMTLDELVNLHQEFLIATLGAVLGVSRARVERESNATTGAFCSLPQDLPRLLRLVQGRQRRIAGAWAAMEARCEPDELVLRRGGSAVPSNLDHDEFRALIAAVDGERGLDEIAAALGLTRGEAIRTASLLVLAGTLAVDQEKRASVPTDRLLVPEAWGDSIDVRAEPDLPAPVTRLAPLGPAAGGVTDGPPAWLPRSVPVVAALAPTDAGPPMEVVEPVDVEPVPVEPVDVEAVDVEAVDVEVADYVEPQPEVATVDTERYDQPEPEPEPEPEPAGADLPGGIGGADALLERHRRLQAATDQALLLEQLLTESIAVEREALDRSAVIRERLRETLAQVAALTSTAAAPDPSAVPQEER